MKDSNVIPYEVNENGELVAKGCFRLSNLNIDGVSHEGEVIGSISFPPLSSSSKKIRLDIFDEKIDMLIIDGKEVDVTKLPIMVQMDIKERMRKTAEYAVNEYNKNI